MQQLLLQLGNVQDRKEDVKNTDPLHHVPTEDVRILELERQVKEINERRMDHMETLQQQQLQMQVNGLCIRAVQICSQYLII